MRPTAQQIYEMIMGAAERQLATTKQARAIIAEGLEEELRELISAIAAQLGNPLEQLIEDAVVDQSAIGRGEAGHHVGL